MSTLDPEYTFATLADSVGLDVRLKKAVARIGHVRPTLVQSKCLPLALTQGRDLMVRARTGSGKTLAYALPVLQKILQAKSLTTTASTVRTGPGGAVRAVIMVPTRELCSQVHKVLVDLIYYCDEIISVAMINAKSLVGNKGADEMLRQEAQLRDKPDIIVATPKGLLTHIRRGALDLKTSVETVVVDEADLVLSFGYSADITEVIQSLPKIYQGFLMSATLSPELDSLKKVILHSPVVVKLEQEQSGKDTTVGLLKQFYLVVPKGDKNLVIYVFLKLGLLKGKGLFFVNSVDSGYRLKLFLEQYHIRSAVLNAELPFRSRVNIVEQFNMGSFDYLIATDSSTDAGKDDKDEPEDGDGEDETKDNNVDTTSKVKADSEYGVSRGVDFRNVSFVVNVELPPNPRSYAHRVGRTARGGAKGVALSLVEMGSKEQHEILHEIQEDQPTISPENASTEVLQATNSQSANSNSSTDQQQPVMLDFDLREIEGFRYRVEDVGRAVTRTAVKEARAAEIKAEMLNSERLQSHFEENPADLQLLRHDRAATHTSKVQEHLRHVPKYLLPRGMQVANVNRKRKKKKKRTTGTGGEKRSDNDPLQNFDGDVNVDDLGGKQGDDDPLAEFMHDDEEDEMKAKKPKLLSEPKIVTSTKVGGSTSGRNQWKEKHRKGQFSGRKRKAERKRKAPLGI